MKHSALRFEVSPDTRDWEKGEVSLPQSKDPNMVRFILWRGDSFKGVLDHIKTGVQELFYPSCTDLAAITVCCDRFWLSNDADVQYILEKEEHPHQNNVLHLTCKYNAERDNERDQATDDQLFDSIIQLCIEDPFPYSKAQFRKHLGKRQDFECVPTRQFYTHMGFIPTCMCSS